MNFNRRIYRFFYSEINGLALFRGSLTLGRTPCDWLRHHSIAGAN
ncbi:MAG: hypothetical protein SPL22_01920 [Treponema sp.]|nr:hypothetical protein [Treponema sp.]MDY6396461.1 hypothetical protein [Treponema sp.]